MHHSHHEIRDAEEYLSRSQVAELFSVSPSTITRWAEEGKLTCMRTLGGHRRYLAQDIRNLVRTLTKEERMETIATEIPKMYGDHHVSAVHQVLSKLNGIHDVRASAATHHLVVAFDPELISAEAILTQLAERGYPPHNGHWGAERDAGRKDPVWSQLSQRITQTNPADR